ncbi:ESX secretion-associated protein EspG [Rhodococcus sp. NPDC003318]|uniref:ESX secretion-associated protein EspG n=1 Tax=Rhodococcus sp. NPDC003318 TaxID=3364503 RepID=UPI0036B863A4
MTAPEGHRLQGVPLSADELDLLMHLMSVDELPVVLAASPRFDSADARDIAFDRARASLGARGLLPGGHPRPDLADRLSVLARPAVELALRWYTGSGAVSRMCLAHTPGTTVVALRGPGTYTLTEVDRADPHLVSDVLGPGTGTDVGTVRAPTTSLVEALTDCTDPAATARRLRALGVGDADADRLAYALSRCHAHAEIVAITHGDGISRTHGPVTVFDTPEGRIVGTSSVAPDGARWSTLGPGGDARVRQAVRELLAATGIAPH